MPGLDGGEAPIRARSAISSTIAQARASLAHPSRPFTPADTGRHLFNLPADGGGAAGEYGARPSSSYAVSASHFSSGRGGAPGMQPGRMPLRGVAHQDRMPIAQAAAARAHAAAELAATSSSNPSSRRNSLTSVGSAAELVLAIEHASLELDGSTGGLDAEQYKLWLHVERELEPLARLSPRSVDGSAAPPVREQCRALEAAVERLCAALDGSQRARQRARVLDAIAPLMEARDPVVVLRLCNVCVRFFAPGGAAAAAGAGAAAGGGGAGAPAAAGGGAAEPGAGARARGSEDTLGALPAHAHAAAAHAPLLSATKLLFRLSKRESNDEHMREEGTVARLLELLLGAVTLAGAAAGQQGGGTPAGTPSATPRGGRAVGAGAGGGGPSTPRSAAALAAAAELAPLREPLVFALGCLKNSTGASAENARALAGAGGIEVLARALREPELARGDAGVQLATQAIALLRNVAAASAAQRRALVSAGVVEALCEWCEAPAAPLLGSAVRAPGAELCLNAFRLLAKLTLQEEARAVINAQPRRLRALVGVLRAHADNEQLLIRVAFVLGNLSASNDANRRRIAFELGGLDTVLAQLQQRTTELLAAQHPAGAPPERTDASPAGAEAAEAGGGGAAAPAPASAPASASASAHPAVSPAADALIKLVRLLAHLAMNAEVGAELAGRAEAGALVQLLEARAAEGAEELLLNTASAITNISYYRQPAAAHAAPTLLREPSRLARALTALLLHPNPEAATEGARALGNCSRAPEVRAALVRARAHEALMLLLGHSSDGVLLAVCGALVNLSADPAHRRALDDAGAAETLAELLEHLLGDASAPLELSVLACKALYNLSLGAPAAPLPPAQQAQLVGALEHFAAAHAAHAPKRGGAEGGAQPSEAASVASVLARALRAAPPQAASAPPHGSDLEPLARPTEADDGEGEVLSREHTHRPLAHDVACG